MNRTEDAVARVLAWFAGSLAVLVAVVAPPLAESPTAGGVALVLLAVAALVPAARAYALHVLGSPHAVRPPERGAPQPHVTGRATDPVHHPLRPRAPGIA